MLKKYEEQLKKDLMDHGLSSDSGLGCKILRHFTLTFELYDKVKALEKTVDELNKVVSWSNQPSA